MGTQYSNINSFDCVSVSSSGIAIYKDFIRRRVKFTEERDESFYMSPENSVSEKDVSRQKITHDRFRNNGCMSDFSCRKMKRALEWLLLIAKNKRVWCKSSKNWVRFRVCFVTLTLASKQRDTDQVIKSKLLNSMLTELRKYNGMKHYVWRAEKQSNGNIHFHLVTDSFIEASKLRERWNRICNTLGYTAEYTARMSSEVGEFSDYYNKYCDQGSYSTLMKRYNYGRATGWTQPNSTDIHSVKKVKNLIAYLFKYLSKNVNNIEELSEHERNQLLVSGQLWGLSESLSKMRSVIIPVCSKVFEEINRLWDNIESFTSRDDWFCFKQIRMKHLFEFNCSVMLSYVMEKMRDTLGTTEFCFSY